ncbi:copper chaperone PCu(A)C [Billgrantia diversa]|uniref:copper chaperone PCu(A)C n=1 Tax=Halomonas sp. MCCC 1A13316 TaxID=2733487 RepID=UPI0018A581AD|nr:copper chaperone PCu(A)C [Halomonas sp. MCCC 1A13316]QOR39719.1 copper chaperone PCu(A)C [Halomonas sp. MCCC 1A13316]
MTLPRLLLLAAGLALASFAAHAEPLTIEGAQVRAVPPGSNTSAAFMTLRNPSERDMILLAAKSPAAEVVELHDHQNVDGVMQMRQVAQIVVPAGGSAELAPGGLHMMLIGLTAPLVEGEPVEIELQFESGDTQRLEAPVKRIVMENEGSLGHGQDQ